jgi:hypothetical protein
MNKLAYLFKQLYSVREKYNEQLVVFSVLPYMVRYGLRTNEGLSERDLMNNVRTLDGCIDFIAEARTRTDRRHKYFDGLSGNHIPDEDSPYSESCMICTSMGDVVSVPFDTKDVYCPVDIDICMQCLCEYYSGHVYLGISPEVGCLWNFGRRRC